MPAPANHTISDEPRTTPQARQRHRARPPCRSRGRGGALRLLLAVALATAEGMAFTPGSAEAQCPA